MNPSLRLVAALATALLLAAPPSGLAQRAIDGDSLLLGGKAYRLHGIDAPDPAQICGDGWPAGYEAQAYLGDLIAGRAIECTPLGESVEGETNAICRADGVDLGAAMVTGGRAFAWVPHSARYVAQEAAAESSGRGLHAHPCLPPWRWRAPLQGKD